MTELRVSARSRRRCHRLDGCSARPCEARKACDRTEGECVASGRRRPSHNGTCGCQRTWQQSAKAAPGFMRRWQTGHVALVCGTVRCHSLAAMQGCPWPAARCLKHAFGVPPARTPNCSPLLLLRQRSRPRCQRWRKWERAAVGVGGAEELRAGRPGTECAAPSSSWCQASTRLHLKPNPSSSRWVRT